jgi:hypothetical protein
MGKEANPDFASRISLCLRAIADAPAADYFDENSVLSKA